MFEVDEYLRKLGCSGERDVSIDALRKLHKQHLVTLPYNSSVPIGKSVVDVDQDALFRMSISEGGGGACFQLNRLFHRLLAELGYDVSFMAASTAEGRENFGTDIEHMFMRVALDGAEWLVDVGYPGPSYLEPLLVTDAAQTQYSCQYRLVEKAGEFEVQRRGRTTTWSVVYTFMMRDRKLDEWRVLDRFTEMAGDTTPDNVSGVLCGRALQNGQQVLKGRRYLVVRDGYEQARSIVDDDEHRALVSSILSGAPV